MEFGRTRQSSGNFDLRTPGKIRATVRWKDYTAVSRALAIPMDRIQRAENSKES